MQLASLTQNHEKVNVDMAHPTCGPFHTLKLIDNTCTTIPVETKH